MMKIYCQLCNEPYTDTDKESWQQVLDFRTHQEEHRKRNHTRNLLGEAVQVERLFPGLKGRNDG